MPIRTGLFVLIGICLLSPVRLLSAPPRPNVLVLLADDLRASALGCYGDRQVQTPVLDGLARRGLKMRNAYIMGGMQGAICVPSRAMFLSGRSLFHISETLAVPEHVTWIELLGKAGYRNFTTGKWHNGPASFARVCGDGDRIFFGGMSNQNRVPLHAFDPEGRYPRDAAKVLDGFSTNLFVDAAGSFLQRTAADEPFCLYVAFTSPHDPRTPPGQFASMYRPEEIELPPNFLPEHPFNNGELRIRDEMLASVPRRPAEIRRHIADYYGMISHLDDQIGRLLAVLEETGRARDTIIVFAGDNGLALGQHGLMGKQNLYEHSTHVPLILAGPGIPVGQESDALCHLFDVYPTLCDLVGLPIPESVEGRSLKPVMEGASQHRDHVFTAYRQVQRAIRNERYKLISYPEAKETQLFDLVDDPWEKHNLAGEPAFAARREELEKLLVAEQMRLDDPLVRQGGPLRRKRP